ncbi:MAG: TonB-dependent receptor [Sterolibacterium sp.]|nr:TonB-dependent receptor [Sterolibacterium sp.]
MLAAAITPQKQPSKAYSGKRIFIALFPVLFGSAHVQAAQAVNRAADATLQPWTAPASDADRAGLEEIVITAQMRRELLQQTPIAITALLSRELETRQINNVLDLASQLPSVSMVPFVGNRAAPNLSIRGAGNIDSQTTKDNSMGFYIDGIPVGRSVGLASDVADLERVELLRGPQGTLYGRNTTGGAINFITAKPERELSFQQMLTLGSDSLYASKTRLNLPLSDSLFTRFTYMRSKDKGWVANRNTTQARQIDFNEDDKEAARWALRLLAGDNFTLDFSLDHSKMTYGNVFFQRITGPNAVAGRQESVYPVKGLTPSLTSIDGQSLTLSWRLNGVELKSITGHRKVSNRVNQNYIDLFTQNGDQTQDQTSQEFQLIGDAYDQRLQYVAGLFHFKENGDERMVSEYGNNLVDLWRVQGHSKSSALYAQATWTPPVIDDRLHLTLGLRQTEDRRAATKHFISSDLYPAAYGQVVPGEKKFRKFTPSYTADFDLTQNINVYAKVALGYRAGGFNTRSTLAGFGQGFDQEDLVSREVGLKSDLLDRRLRLNLAAFDNKFTNLQVDQVRIPAIFTDTLNAGRARIQGLEMELTALLSRELTVNVFYTHLDAKYASYIDNGVELAAVKHLPNAPRHQGGVNLRYRGGLLGPGRFAADLDYHWQSTVYANPNPIPTAGYGVWNARLQLTNIRLPRGELRLALWGRNLADRKYAIATSNLGGGGLSAQFGQPRTLGIDAIFEY